MIFSLHEHLVRELIKWILNPIVWVIIHFLTALRTLYFLIASDLVCDNNYVLVRRWYDLIMPRTLCASTCTSSVNSVKCLATWRQMSKKLLPIFDSASLSIQVKRKSLIRNTILSHRKKTPWTSSTAQYGVALIITMVHFSYEYYSCVYSGSPSSFIIAF